MARFNEQQLAILRSVAPIDVEWLTNLCLGYHKRLDAAAVEFPDGIFPKKDAKRFRGIRRRLNEAEARLRADHTDEQWNLLVEACDGSCVGCGCRPDSLCADHINPITKGGSSSIANIQPLCRECNSTDKFNHTDKRPDWVIGLFA